MDELSQYRNDIHEQASDWFALIYIGTPSIKEREEFTAWCRSHHSHRQAYQELILVWEDMTLSASDNNLAEHALTAHSVPALDTQPLPHPSPYPATPTKRARRSVLQSMTGVGIAACALVLSAYLLPIGTLFSHKPTPHILQTAVGETSQFTLPDGSHINLSGNSRIEYRIGKTRQVTLTQGQAYFTVVSLINDMQQKVPFEVLTPDFTIAVVGTAFDVNTHSTGTSIAVAQGKVNVAHSHQQATLVAGQTLATAKQDRDRLTPTINIAQEAIGSWRNGRLVYVDTPLSVVIDDARRFYTGSIILADPELAELRVTATFNTHQIHAMTKMLEQLLPIKVYSQDNGQKITLVKRR